MIQLDWCFYLHVHVYLYTKWQKIISSAGYTTVTTHSFHFQTDFPNPDLGLAPTVIKGQISPRFTYCVFYMYVWPNYQVNAYKVFWLSHQSFDDRYFAEKFDMMGVIAVGFIAMLQPWVKSDKHSAVTSWNSDNQIWLKLVSTFLDGFD